MKNFFDTPRDTAKEEATVHLQANIKSEQFFQRGLGLKKEVQEVLKKEYFSNLIAFLRTNDYELKAGGITLHLAREFGFCYGVDRAVDYAYQAREKFPDRRIFITGEIIHNPHVNNRLIEMGIEFLSGQYNNGLAHDDLKSDDVVILPAFGVSIQEFQTLKAKECILVDTTCGSVLNVWKRVVHYAKNGFTSIIHGKYFHEETIATSSQALKYRNGKYFIVRNMTETQKVCDYIMNGGNRDEFMNHFEKSMSPGFDPDRDLAKVGVANQTTMLSSESLAIADRLRQAILIKFGRDKLDDHFQTFDTICSATQDRQDAVLELVTSKDLDLMLVVGGFNSSNTTHLAELTSKYVKTYHVDDPASLFDDGSIKHKEVGTHQIVKAERWLPVGDFTLGITAGASTPNNKIGQAIEKIMLTRDVDLPAILKS